LPPVLGELLLRLLEGRRIAGWSYRTRRSGAKLAGGTESGGGVIVKLGARVRALDNPARGTMAVGQVITWELNGGSIIGYDDFGTVDPVCPACGGKPGQTGCPLRVGKASGKYRQVSTRAAERIAA
jgi:hypothetical protein